MSATVIALESRRKPPPEPDRDCPCRPGRVCRSHRVINLAAAVRAHREHHGDELLLTAADVDVLLDYLLDVLDGITAETYPHGDQRTAR